MKKKFKILTILLVTSVFISSISFGAFGEDSGSDIAYLPELQNGTETELEESADTSSVDEERDFIDETETAYFEFTEADLSSSSRAIGGGEVDFGPPDDDTSTTLLITSDIIPDGVYAIESVYAPGLWIDVNNATEPGYIVWQDYHSRPTNSFNRIALFKIKYVPDTQSYIIRLMTNNMLTLGFDSSENVITKTIFSPYDSQVPPSETFTITRMTNGYMIRQYGETDEAIACKSDVGGDFYYPESALEESFISEVGDKAKWNFYKYTGVDKHGMLISYSSSYTSVGIPVGTTGTMRSKTWSTVIGSNIPMMQADTNSTDMISMGNTNNIGETTFTALSPGYATIQSMILRESTGTSQYTERKYFQIIPQEGNYVIRNVGTAKYIDIDSESTANGALINQSSFSTQDSQKWIIEYVSNGEGYVRIKSAYSNKYIGVDSTDGTTIRQYSSQNNYTLWKFERTTSGNLKLVCKALASTLAIKPTATSSGANLKLVTYLNNTDYSDEWVLSKITVFYGIQNTGHDHLTCLETIKNDMSVSRCNYVLLKSGSMSAQECKNDLNYTNIFTSRSHGTLVKYTGGGVCTTGILLNDEEGDNKTHLFAHSFSNLTETDDYLKTGEDYSNIDVVLFVGCNTAEGGVGARNLPTKIVELGAKTSIGFEESIGCNAANTWTEDFYTYFLSGHTVEESAEYACRNLPENSALRSYVICGDPTTKYPLCQ